MIDTDSISNLAGATVESASGEKIGTVGQVYVDDETGQPSWITVRTGLFGTSESFIPLDNVTLDGDRVQTDYEKEFVKDAPRVDNDGSLSPEEEDRLYEYYSRSDSSPAAPASEAIADYDGTDRRTRIDNDLDSSNAGTDYRAGEFDSGPTTGSFGKDTGIDQGVDADRPLTDRLESNRTATDATAAGDGEGIVGHDTSGPTTDDAMTRSEERLDVGTERVETGRARLRKYVVTNDESVTVPLTREEVRIEREPITDANRTNATSGPDISDEEHEVILTEDRVVVNKETVPVERVRLAKETVTEDETVTEQVRSEEIALDEPGVDTDGTRRDRRDNT